MSTGIEWTDETWNPIRGCSRVSEGCRNCYAEKVAYRFSGPGQPYEGLVTTILRVSEGGVTRHPGPWNGDIQFVEEHLLDPLKWKKPRRIFVNSMSDLFHENVADEMLDRIFAVMALCPQHTFQVLTKRPERMLANGITSRVYNCATAMVPDAFSRMPKEMPHHRSSGDGWWPLQNVRLGVSVENQAAADERLDYLCELASFGWQTMVSFEPLLSAVDPGPWWLSLGNRTWAIVGGESGPGARPMHPDWARGLRDQCQAAGVPFFFKQWGEWSHANYKKPSGSPGRYALMPQNGGDLCLYGGNFVELDHYPRQFTSFGSIVRERVGKKAAGHLLDGVEHHAFPAVRA